MQRTPVESSNVASVGFEDSTLEVEFTSGAIYRYSNVPERIHDELLASNSKGRYLNEHIKNTFAYLRT